MDLPTQRLDQPAPNEEQSPSCPKCNGTMIWARAATTPGLMQRGFSDLEVHLEQLHGSILWGPKQVTLTALVCVECGYTEFYASEPQKLMEQ